MSEKYCTRCETTKLSSEFSKDKYNKDNLSTYCKLCNKKRAEVLKEKKKYVSCSYMSKFFKDYKFCPQCKKYKLFSDFYINNWMACGVTSACKICSLAISRINYNNNKNNEQSEERRKRTNYLSMKRYENRSFLQKFRQSLSSNIRSCLKSKGFKKTLKSEKILCCSKEFFIKYIESKFVDGMSWDNRNKWHLDHIIPISTAKTKEDAIKLCHYTNYQPLWARDNLSKSDKIPNNVQLKFI